jgi:hypothetical protein
MRLAMRSYNRKSEPLTLVLTCDPARFQSFLGDAKCIVDIATARRRKLQTVATAERLTVAMRCKLFGQGREDWNRGLRELHSTTMLEGQMTRLADGTILLSGVPLTDVRLNRAQIDRARKDGLRLVSTEIEVDIDSASFENALLSLPCRADHYLLNS